MKLSLVFLLFSLTLVTGCSTVATTAVGANGEFDCTGGHRIPRVYSGVANDIRFWHTTPLDRGFIVIDLPFSALADTLLLPYSIPMQKKHGDLCSGDKKP